MPHIVVHEGDTGTVLDASTYWADPDTTMTCTATYVNGALLTSNTLLAFDPATLIFSLQGAVDPALTNVTYEVAMRCQDECNVEVLGTFLLTVNDLPTTLDGIPDVVLGQNVAWEYTIPLSEFTDNDGYTLTVAPLPAGLTFDATTNTISGTPTAAGTTSVVV